MRALRDDEREQAAAIVAVWLVEHAVEIAAEYPTGTNFVPVAIDHDRSRISVIAQMPGMGTGRLTEIPMLAAA